jgi:hypothetical protein
MTNVIINPNTAQQITADTTETFDDFANRVFKTSKRAIRHGNGEPVEIEPGAKYAVLALKLSEIATPEQFNALFEIIMQSVEQATQAEIIPPDWFQGLTTLFDLFPPTVPEQFQEAGHEIKAYFTGEAGFVMTKTPIITEPPTDDDAH